jgi:hypothetical protein
MVLYRLQPAKHRRLFLYAVHSHNWQLQFSVIREFVKGVPLFLTWVIY